MAKVKLIALREFSKNNGQRGTYKKGELLSETPMYAQHLIDIGLAEKFIPAKHTARVKEKGSEIAESLKAQKAQAEKLKKDSRKKTTKEDKRVSSRKTK